MEWRGGVTLLLPHAREWLGVEYRCYHKQLCNGVEAGVLEWRDVVVE